MIIFVVSLLYVNRAYEHM